VPFGNEDPEAWLPLTVGVPQLSVAVGGVQVATAVHTPGSAGSVMFPGQGESTGGIVSLTVMVCVHVAWFPTPSWMMEAQVGISFLTQAVGPNRTNLVAALQTAYGFGGFGNATLFVGPNVAFQYLATGTLPSTNDAALGLAFGYRWLPLTFLAVRLEARYRYWLDRMIHETGGALGFGVVIP